jgi:superfamily II DNA or RNA helicase
MKACRKGHVVDKDVFTKDIEKELTVAPLTDPQFGGFPKKNRYFVWNKNRTRVALPRFFKHPGLDADAVEKSYGRVGDVGDRLVFRGSLKPELRQPEAVGATLDSMRATGGAILSLAPGWGKTTISLYVACALGLKTLVVVHKEFLMNQWIERIRQFVPEARIGRLQQNTVDVDDKEIVVAMIHSIALRSYPEGTFDGFGLTIVDECHHVSAPVFSQAMHVANAPYVLGLTATPERRDGLQRVLHWYLGDISFQTQREHRADVKVDVVRSDIKDISPPINRRTGNICMASFITALTEDAERNRLVMSVIRKYHGQPGRKILVLSDRRFHCDFMLEQCRRLGIDAGLYLGGMSASDLETSASKPVILATYALATEGLDIPTLDTLLLATPKSDVVQATGRILREGFGKLNGPVIIDMVDSFSIFYAQFNKRKAFYTRSGFDLGKAEPKALDFITDDD